MRKQAIPELLTLLAIFCLVSCRTQPFRLVQVRELPSYPSASGIEYSGNHVYVIGDDAVSLLILDSALRVTDSIMLVQSEQNRIPKSIKPDLEGICRLPGNRLLLTGSGSLSPHRNVAWIISPLQRKKDSIRMDTIYSRLPLYGIKEINIEGITELHSGILMGNRGNLGYPKNHFIFLPGNFMLQQQESDIRTILAGTNSDSSSFAGVSGLAYAPKNDLLLVTASTENTVNSMDDGAIGKSYLWIIKNISRKLKWKAINPDIIIDLEETDDRFKGQKIESVCILNETGNELHLLLSADNDNGRSRIFSMILARK